MSTGSVSFARPPISEKPLALRNHRPELDFWGCRKSFRNWAPGADTTAGAWLADTGRNATGVVGALDSNILPSGVFFTDGRGVTAVSSGDRSIVKMDLSKQWKGHVGTEFSPEHIWQPAILYLGRPAQV